MPRKIKKKELLGDCIGSGTSHVDGGAIRLCQEPLLPLAQSPVLKRNYGYFLVKNHTFSS